MKKTFEHIGDTMPSYLYFFQRNKLVHVQGVVASVRL